MPRMRRRSVSRLSCGSRPVLTSSWVVVATVVAGRETSTFTGLCRNCSVMRRISGGMVAVKNSVWRVNGTSLQMRSMSGNEAHVEHAVGFVDDEQLDAGEQEPAALEMVEQAAGRGDQHVDAARELGVLVVERHAADHQRDVELVACAVFVEALLHLRGELARRLQDQRARHARAGAALLQHGEHRQREGGGLAGAGLGDAEHVAAREHVRDRLFLDGGGGGVAGRLNRGENFVGQAELGKGHKTSSRDRPEPSRAG